MNEDLAVGLRRAANELNRLVKHSRDTSVIVAVFHHEVKIRKGGRVVILDVVCHVQYVCNASLSERIEIGRVGSGAKVEEWQQFGGVEGALHRGEGGEVRGGAGTSEAVEFLHPSSDELLYIAGGEQAIVLGSCTHTHLRKASLSFICFAVDRRIRY